MTAPISERATQSTDPTAPPDPTTRPGFDFTLAWAAAVAGMSLILAAVAGAWWQAPRPAALVAPAAFTLGNFDAWRYPLESNPALRLPAIQGNLRGVHALADGKRVWVVGEGGLILHSSDGGITWTQQHPKPAVSASQASEAALPGLIGNAYAGLDPRQQTTAPPEQKIAPTARTIEQAALPKQTVSPARSVPLKKPPVAKAYKPAAKAIVKPADIKPPPDDVDLYSVFFLDAKRGWAAGDQGKVWSTRDGGETWRAGFVGERVRIVDVYLDGGDVVAASAEGRLFRGSIGTDAWRPESANAPTNLVKKLVAPGPGGIAFADAKHGWAVGDAGSILHSDDSGQTWRAQTGGARALAARRAGIENRRTPAPWTWLTLLLGVGLIAWGVRRIDLPNRAAGQTAGIAGLFVSDQPLKPGDTDHLGHARIARGLADFIRNRNTEPGLTLAVTGSWGSGKSSIMRLLEDDLKRAGFRPAWFNAWHHQQEGRQLASMFNTIRQQAVPPIQTPAAWRVRAALYWNRGWLYRLLALGVLGLFLLGLFEAQNKVETPDKQAPFSQLRQAVVGALMDVRPVVITSASLEKLRKGGVMQPGTLATLTGQMVWQPQAGQACRDKNGDCRFDDLDQLYASVNRVMAPIRLTDEEKQALAEAAQHLGSSPQTMLGVLLGALVIPLLLGKGLAVYGFHYLDVLKRLLPERGKVEGKEAVGTMENFRTEFCNLTQALDGRLVLFIDDLDRCDCATVREVLELVNYLVSVGQCFVVLGMAMEHVACCIEPKSPKQQADGYAMQYLKKLVNIEVPVPKADLNGIRAMLEGQAQASERPADSEPARRWAAWGISLAVLVALTWGMHRTWTQWHLEAEPKTFLTAAPALDTATPPAQGVAGNARPRPAAPPQDQADTAGRGPIGLLPGVGAKTGAWAALLSLLALAALAAGTAWPARTKWLDWLHRHGILQAIKIGLGGAERKRDTPAFRAALEGWHKVIVAGDPTPRGIKRFVNRVRLLAMMEQALEDDQIPEGVLVGLAALHHAKVEYSDDFSASFNAADFEAQGTESKQTPSRPDLYNAIQAAIQPTPGWPPTPLQVERFLHMVEYMHVR